MCAPQRGAPCAVLLLGVSQEVAKNNAGILFGAHLTFSYPLMKNFALQNSSWKERNTIQRSPWEPPPSRRLETSPVAALPRHPPHRGGSGKSFYFSVRFQLSSIAGREAETNVVCKSKVRATSVSATFFKSHSQKLKLSAFAPCCEIYLARNGARTRGSKGESP